MSKMSTDLNRQALNGATMGTRWSALFFTRSGFDVDGATAALQSAVALVDRQMSTWNPDSDLMRLNRAPVGEWVSLPPDLMQVLVLGLATGRASGGAFDIGVGDAVRAWGFGPDPADQLEIGAAMRAKRVPAHEALELDGNRIRKAAPITLDLNGIAKGYGVDRLAEVLQAQGLSAGLVGIDGEMRGFGLRPDGAAWVIAVEAPDTDRRAPHSMLTLRDAAVATSGDYRHWVAVQGRRLSHTMDPASGAPLQTSPASVTVVASTCAKADAWATALMVAGPEHGADLAERNGLHALFVLRDGGGGLHAHGVGSLFHTTTAAMAPDIRG